MDATQLEETIATAVRKALPKDVSVVIAPAGLGKFSGVRPEVFLHASEFLDFDGRMIDGSTIARYPAKGPSTYRGFEESRPVQLLLSVTVIDSAYSRIKSIANLLLPTVLLALESIAEFSLGQLANGSVKLNVKDLQRSLYRSNIERIDDVDGVSLIRAEYEFKIRGFLDVWITKRGGLRSPSKVQAKPSSKPKTKLKLKASKPKPRAKSQARKIATDKVAKKLRSSQAQHRKSTVKLR